MSSEAVVRENDDGELVDKTVAGLILDFVLLLNNTGNKLRGIPLQWLAILEAIK